MQGINRECYIAVSDLALCQKCPALLAYKIHMGESSVWRVGIKGNGEAYGSVFHKHIARIFFDGASKPNHPLHDDIRHAVSGGEKALENVIRENIFLPFIEKNADRFNSEILIEMAKGVTVWVKVMSEFFRCIPSLMRHTESNMLSVFKEPEHKLQSTFDFDDGGRLVITGCYDALMFNPDRAEARIFEFKSYMKSDITVSLSQSLIYSWLIWRKTGIVPSIEIIYLGEEDKQPDIFDSRSVVSIMSSTLPKLFQSAFNIMSLRRKPETLQNIDLCPSCRYSNKCRDDMTKLFRGASGRNGSSLANVLVFFLIALTMTAQAFFFLVNSSESVSEEREMMQVRLKLDALVEDAKSALETITPSLTSISIWGKKKTVYSKSYALFSDTSKDTPPGTKTWENGDVAIFDLYYTLMNKNDDATTLGDTTFVNRETKDLYRKIYPALGKNYFLIRARIKLPQGNYIMRQVVVEKSGSHLYTHSNEEVFYWDDY